MTVISQPSSSSLLAYDAPINEKTQEIRKRFNLDEKTGYPKEYSWRALARLGPEYRPEELYQKLDPFDPKEEIATNVFICGSTAAVGLIAHWYYSYLNRRPLWSGIPRLALSIGFVSWCGLKVREFMLRRQGIKNAIIVDYTTQHPERFEAVKRYKYREILAPYYPKR